MGGGVEVEVEGGGGFDLRKYEYGRTGCRRLEW